MDEQFQNRLSDMVDGMYWYMIDAIQAQRVYTWYNFDTKQYDSGPADMTNADDVRPYVPDIPAARGLYKLLIDRGNDPLRASAYVHEAVLVIPHTTEVVGV